MLWSKRKIRISLLIFFGVCLFITGSVVMKRLMRPFYTSLEISDALGYYASQNEGALPASWDEFVKAGYGKWSLKDSDTLLARYRKEHTRVWEIYPVSDFKVLFGLKPSDFIIKEEGGVYDVDGNKIYLISLVESDVDSCSVASLELARAMKEAEATAKKDDGAAKEKTEGIDQNQAK